jgi:ribonuclease PH
MNAGTLKERLQGEPASKLRELCASLLLSARGTRGAMIRRIVDMHADPCCSIQVATEVLASTKRTKRKRSTAARDLTDAFDAAAAAEPAACGAHFGATFDS